LMQAKNILVVDDDVSNTDIVKLILESHGHRVSVSYSGKDAMQKVVQVRPDLAVLDVKMPDVDGYAVCKFIKGHPALSPVKVILLTSQDLEKNVRNAEEAGADAFLEKPCSVEKLIETVNRLLALRPA